MRGTAHLRHLASISWQSIRVRERLASSGLQADVFHKAAAVATESQAAQAVPRAWNTELGVSYVPGILPAVPRLHSTVAASALHTCTSQALPSARTTQVSISSAVVCVHLLSVALLNLALLCRCYIQHELLGQGSCTSSLSVLSDHTLREQNAKGCCLHSGRPLQVCSAEASCTAS